MHFFFLFAFYRLSWITQQTGFFYYVGLSEWHMIQGNFHPYSYIQIIVDLTVKGAVILTIKCTADFYTLFSEIYTGLCSFLLGLIFHTSIEEK